MRQRRWPKPLAPTSAPWFPISQRRTHYVVAGDPRGQHRGVAQLVARAHRQRGVDGRLVSQAPRLLEHARALRRLLKSRRSLGVKARDRLLAEVEGTIQAAEGTEPIGLDANGTPGFVRIDDRSPLDRRGWCSECSQPVLHDAQCDWAFAEADRRARLWGTPRPRRFRLDLRGWIYRDKSGRLLARSLLTGEMLRPAKG